MLVNWYARGKEKIAMIGGMVDLPNYQAKKWINFQPPISKMNWLQTVKNLHTEIISPEKNKKRQMNLVSSHEIKKSLGR